jgi:hypothetical protein
MTPREVGLSNLRRFAAHVPDGGDATQRNSPSESTAQKVGLEVSTFRPDNRIESLCCPDYLNEIGGSASIDYTSGRRRRVSKTLLRTTNSRHLAQLSRSIRMKIESESLQKWALFAEIIGGIAVVVSLVLVAYEIRQSTDQAALNTSALQIAAYQDLINGISQINAMVAQDGELAKIVMTAKTTPEQLSDVERQRFLRFVLSIFRHGDMAYFQYQQGLVDRRRLDSALGIVLAELNNSAGAQQIWSRVKDVFADEYVVHVDGLLKSKSSVGGESTG